MANVPDTVTRVAITLPRGYFETLTAATLLVYGYLHEKAAADRSIKIAAVRIAHDLGMSMATVGTSVVSLRDAGLLKMVGGTPKVCRTYYLTAFEEL